MNNKEYIAYRGKKFTIEWYFNKKHQSLALDYFESLNDEEQIKVLRLFQLIGEIGKIQNKTKFNYEGDEIYAFKPQPHRFLCFFYKDGKIIVTNAFYKKTERLPKHEKVKALKFKEDYELQTQIGEYYD